MQPSAPNPQAAPASRISTPVKWFLVIHVALTVLLLIPQFIFMVRGATTVDVIGFDTAFGRVECWSFMGRGMMVLRDAPPGPATWTSDDRVLLDYEAAADSFKAARTSWTVMGLTMGTHPLGLHIALWWLAVNTAIQGALPFATIWMFRRSAPPPGAAVGPASRSRVL